MKKRIMRLAKTIENGEYCIILYFMLMVSNALFWYERDIRNTGIIIALIAFQTLYMYFIGGNTEKEVDKAIRNFLILNIILFVIIFIFNCKVMIGYISSILIIVVLMQLASSIYKKCKDRPEQIKTLEVIEIGCLLSIPIVFFGISLLFFIKEALFFRLITMIVIDLAILYFLGFFKEQ